MSSSLRCLSLLLAFVTAGWMATAAPAMEHWPSSELLLPCFELRYDETLTTFFAVVNSGQEPAEIEISLESNWGIPVLITELTLAPNAVAPINLRDWLVGGVLPDRVLGPEEIAHAQSAFCGERSDQDGLFYSILEEAGDPLLGVGTVRIRMKGERRPDVLWGDFFIVDPPRDFAQGEVLVNLDPRLALASSSDDDDLCRVHGFRFLEGGGFSGGTEFMVWNPTVGETSADGFTPNDNLIPARLEVYAESGALLEVRDLELISMEMVHVADLGLPKDFGWLKLDTGPIDAFVTVRYSADARYSVAFEAWCLPRSEDTGPTGPAIDLEKWVNGEDADFVPGYLARSGEALEWGYMVRNIGNQAIENIEVFDDDPALVVTCPGDRLEPGEIMRCTAEGFAEQCRYRNVGVAEGVAVDGTILRDGDPAHYTLAEDPAIDLEKATNAADADEAPGPVVLQGDPVLWTFTVTNVGAAPLVDVRVSDDVLGVIGCPKDALDVGESMVCEVAGVAALGQHANFAAVTATTECGMTVSDADPSHYYGEETCEEPSIDVEKSTNGMDADQPTGPVVWVGDPIEWLYTVTNSGAVALEGVVLSDSEIGLIGCPETTLLPGESMVCAAQGSAILGQYANLATVTGRSPKPCNGVVTDSDPSHYFGEPLPCEDWHPAIGLEKLTNGEDADQGSGPRIPMGDPVEWTYIVTNLGDTDLFGVAVQDDHLGAVSCPKTMLTIGESMTCTAHGTAIFGPYQNVGTVTASSPEPCGQLVRASDPSRYHGYDVCGEENPAIQVEKSTNGMDADLPPGPDLLPGDPVEWTYVITNTGNVPLKAIHLEDDDFGVVPSCPGGRLEPGESRTCTMQGAAVVGQYRNLATVRARTATECETGWVSSEDPSHYLCTDPCDVPVSIQLEKLINGLEADQPPGPEIPVGDPITWTYVVVNTGALTLTGLAVTDNVLGPVCSGDTLAPGASMTCTLTGTAEVGEHANLGTVTAGVDACDKAVEAEDWAHYLGTEPCRGDEGCTPGYWKNHTGKWEGLAPNQTVESIFMNAMACPEELVGATLLQALKWSGGNEYCEMAQLLVHHALASALNALHSGVDHPMSYADIVMLTDLALASGDVVMVEAQKNVFDANNNLGCPL